MVDPTRPASWTHTALAQQIAFGVGALDRLPELVRTIGARRAMLVTTAGRFDSAEGDAVVAKLGRALVSTFAEVQSHVPIPLVQQAVQQARRDAVDLVVSFGGGSCAAGTLRMVFGLWADVIAQGWSVRRGRQLGDKIGKAADGPVAWYRSVLSLGISLPGAVAPRRGLVERRTTDDTADVLVVLPRLSGTRRTVALLAHDVAVVLLEAAIDAAPNAESSSPVCQPEHAFAPP